MEDEISRAFAPAEEDQCHLCLEHYPILGLRQAADPRPLYYYYEKGTWYAFQGLGVGHNMLPKFCTSCNNRYDFDELRKSMSLRKSLEQNHAICSMYVRRSLYALPKCTAVAETSITMLERDALQDLAAARFPPMMRHPLSRMRALAWR